jgi:hypothetical protein
MRACTAFWLLFLHSSANAGVVGGTHNFMCSPSGEHGPCIDHSKDPAAATGHTVERVKFGALNAAANPRGAFRTTCKFSHTNHDDPIVYPNQPGRSHAHTYFGNTGANAHSTYESLRSSGNSTCMGGIANRTAYWVPSLVDGTTGSIVWPLGALVYYKDEAPGIPLGAVVAPPNGLKLLAGDMTRTPKPLQPWQIPADAYWTCQATTGTTIDPRTGAAYPATPVPAEMTKASAGIPDCPVGSMLNMMLSFPRCLALNPDGTPMLDSPDHRAHAVRANHYTGCPVTHPLPIPQITEVIHYLVTDPIVTESTTNPDTGEVTPTAWRWRLSSDMYGHDKQPGWSGHGDWFDGWDPQIKALWTAGCLHTPLNCHNDLLGPKTVDPSDGQERTRTLY